MRHIFKILQISDFQFTSPRLTFMEFTTNPTFTQENEAINFNNEIKVDVPLRTDNFAQVVLTLFVRAESENTPFTLNVSITVDFMWSNYSEEQVMILLKSNAPALLLSYLRPIVANITNSAGFPVYNLPLVNFTE